MPEFRFPILDEQSAYAVKAVVWRARVVADLGIAELRYYQLFAMCAQHGEFSQTFCEDEIVAVLARAENERDRPSIRCPSCASVEPSGAYRSMLYRQVPNPYRV